MPSISGKFTREPFRFEFNEERIGHGKSRGISVRAANHGRHSTYRLEPNPHEDAWYNKHQEEFYAEAAGTIAALFVTAGGKFPRYDRAAVTVHAVPYHLLAPS